jgi:hypothetical protein
VRQTPGPNPSPPCLILLVAWWLGQEGADRYSPCTIQHACVPSTLRTKETRPSLPLRYPVVLTLTHARSPVDVNGVRDNTATISSQPSCRCQRHYSSTQEVYSTSPGVAHILCERHRTPVAANVAPLFLAVTARAARFNCFS